MAIQVNINRESWPLESEFRISRGSRKVSDVITVSISEEKFTGRGEVWRQVGNLGPPGAVALSLLRLIL